MNTEYTLLIAEKPSVAKSIAAVIGADQRNDGYLEGNGYLVSWCVGHLVELSMPEAYDEKYKKWNQSDLPIMPEHWKYQVSSGTAKQYRILKELAGRNDVTQLICATDAGREGELIFRLVYHQMKCKKPFRRLWISSMEDQAIRDGMENLKPSEDYDALYEAALCRERADWIVGINATRLYSCLYGSTLNVGRVMTPTLAMVVEREQSIRNFVPEAFYTVQLQAEELSVSSKRIKDKREAETLAAECRKNHTVRITKIETKEKQEKPPLLYDLTSLQRDANKILGYSAQETLDALQGLYEKKMVTYPRTDSRYLTDDMAEKIPELVKVTADALSYADEFPINPERVINSSKVTDHHAVIPTAELSREKDLNLSEKEADILKLVCVWLLCAVGDSYRYQETVITAECAGESFTSKGSIVIDAGWKKIQNSFYPTKDKKSDSLPAVKEGDEIIFLDAAVKEGKTEPKQHFTEGTLLHAMETAGAEEIPEEAERKGLGTPATRAGIIEKLIQKGYINRSGRNKTKILIPTDRGEALIAVMPEKIRSPKMTAEWEQKLLEIEKDQLSGVQFMDEIGAYAAQLVRETKKQEDAKLRKAERSIIGICPHCGSEVIDFAKSWHCSAKDCRFVLWKDNAYFKKIGKKLTEPMAKELIQDRKIRLTGCVSKRTGSKYNAIIHMDTEDSGRPAFTMEFEQKRKSKEKP